MAGPLPAPDPPPQTTSSHLLQATNRLPLSSSNQIQENPSPLLLRPSDPSVWWSDPAASSIDQRLLLPSEPAVPAPVLALPAHNPLFPSPSLSSSAAPSVHASAPACPSPELAPPSPAISVSAPASASAPASQVLSSSVEPPPGHQLLAAPEPPPAMPPVSAAAFPPLSNSLPISPHHAEAPLSAQQADLQKRLPPVRRNAQVNPPHLKSYAQAAKGAPGPGFVRAHARDVDSFARLPRTGINVICGTREGIPVFSLVQSDMHKVEGLYAKALVMKFHGGRPSLAASHKEISCWGLESPFSIGPLTSRSFLLRFQDERDLLKILTRPSSTLISFPYKIFRWHSRCHKNEDSVMVPVWISLPGLPLQCFAPEFLESIANRIGRFLCLDKATATLARPSTARFCIELDLRKARPQCVLIDLFEGHRQPIVYERLPKFCMGCHMQGHTNAECSKPPVDTNQPPESGLNPVQQFRPLAARRNAEETLSTDATPLLPLDNPLQSPASSVAATAVPLPALDPQQATPDLTHQQLHPSSSVAAPAHLPAPLPTLQSSNAEALHQSLPPSSSNAKAQQVSNASPESAPVAVLSPTQSLSAQAAPFSPSDPVQSMQKTSPSSSNKISPSPRHLFPAIRLMPHPRSTPVRSNAAVASPATAPPLHQSQPQHPPPPSSTNRSKHKKSVSFMPQQSNIQANQVLWDVVNRQIEHFNKSSNERDPVYPHKEPPDPSFFSHFESDSEASVEAISPTGSHSAIAQEEGSSFPQSYASEGEELNVEPITLQGHISDDAFYQRPKSSKRNKRHPDGPLKVKLRARKGSSSIHR